MTDLKNLQARAAALAKSSQEALDEELEELREIRDEIDELLQD